MPSCLKCSKKSTFNFVGLKPQFCLEHKDEGMIDVFNKKCIVCNLSQPNYNLAGLKAEYCKSCKTAEMIDISHKKCKCGLARPTFNIAGSKKAEFCKECKTEDMENILDVKCHCKKHIPCFNFEGLKAAYCFECKTELMINVKGKKCACGLSRPNFNYTGLIAKYCSKCKLENMLDVTHPACFCQKSQPTYNYAGLQRKYCVECRLEGMINVIQPFCHCKKAQPTFNFEGLPAEYCSLCKSFEMVDVKHISCKTYLCNIRVQEKYDGYCFRCFIHLFPNKPVSKNYKTKEFAVVEYIMKIFPEFTWTADKVVKDGCSKKRPDLLLDLGYQIIIIEVDENKHSKYDSTCENARLMTISQDLGHRPIIFIRFNPDSYINILKERIKSCWDITAKSGLMKIVNQKEWTNRLEKLKQCIDYWTNPKNNLEKTIEIVQLYYDDFA
jgi:hypothetical protein